MNNVKSTRPLLLVGGGSDAVDVQYAAGFSAPDPFLFLLRGEEAHVLVSLLEWGRAGRENPALIRHSADTLNLKGASRRHLGRQAVALLRTLELKRVDVSGRCPVSIVRELERNGVRVCIARDPLFPGRAVKSDREVAFLKQAQRAAVSSMRAAMDLIRSANADSDSQLLTPDGDVLTSERVRAAVRRDLLDNGCDAESIIVAGGDQAVDPHEEGRGPLCAGQPVVLDIFPRASSGYWGDITRTVIHGKPRPEQKRLYTTVLSAQKEALKRVAPGVTGREIHAHICRRFEEAGYETGMRDGVPQGFIHSTGHGVGLEIHEGPSVSPSGGELKPGHVITIEPGLYYLGIGGVRIEDTVVVTPDGCRPLATCHKRFAL